MFAFVLLSIFGFVGSIMVIDTGAQAKLVEERFTSSVASAAGFALALVACVLFGSLAPLFWFNRCLFGFLWFAIMKAGSDLGFDVVTQTDYLYGPTVFFFPPYLLFELYSAVY